MPALRVRKQISLAVLTTIAKPLFHNLGHRLD